MSTDWIKRLRDPVTGRYISTAQTRFKHKFKGGEVDVTMNTAALRVFCALQMRGLLRNVCKAGVEGAKARVAPGIGPGPHPHRTDTGWTHEDTGNLMSAIKWGMDEPSQVAGMINAIVYVDAQKAPYGLWLELGWHGPSGKFYRYPYIAPAVYEALAQSHGWVHVNGLLPYESGAPE